MARVLIVEDDKEVRHLLSSILEADGHEVVQAASAREADPHLEGQLDAIFLDVDMPGETGAELLFRIRGHDKHKAVPVSFVTAHPDRVARVVASGVTRWLIEKPFKKQQIVDTLAAMLREAAPPRE